MIPNFILWALSAALAVFVIFGFGAIGEQNLRRQMYDDCIHNTVPVVQRSEDPKTARTLHPYECFEEIYNGTNKPVIHIFNQDRKK